MTSKTRRHTITRCSKCNIETNAMRRGMCQPCYNATPFVIERRRMQRLGLPESGLSVYKPSLPRIKWLERPMP